MKLPKFARPRSLSTCMHPPHAQPSQAPHFSCFSLSRPKQPSPAAAASPPVDTATTSQASRNLPNAAPLQYLPSNPMHEMKQVFAQFDANHDGKISVDELAAVLRSLGVETTREDAELMIKEVDANGDGSIDLQEFMELHRDYMQVIAQDELRATFEMFDLNKDGHITAQELHAVLTNLGDDGHTSLEDCNRMICRVDRKGVGHVDLDDFKLMMMHV